MATKRPTKPKQDIPTYQPKEKVKPQGEFGSHKKPKKAKKELQGENEGIQPKSKKNTSGRPAKYRTAEEMQKEIDIFFETVKIPTVAGLARSLGFLDRDALRKYEVRDSGFSSVVKRARNRIEEFVETRLNSGENCTGAIFWLKNHAGYRDRDREAEDRERQNPVLIQVNFPDSPNNPAQIAINGKSLGR